MQTAMVQTPIAMPAKAVTARRTAAPVSCTLRQDAARVAKAAGESQTGVACGAAVCVPDERVAERLACR